MLKRFSHSDRVKTQIKPVRSSQNSGTSGEPNVANKPHKKSLSVSTVKVFVALYFQLYFSISPECDLLE